MTKHPTVFFVTVLSMDRHERRIMRNSRTWGFFYDFEVAERVVLENQTDIYECLYDYAVIEEYSQGILRLPKEKQWYKAVYRKGQNNPRVVKVKKPSALKRVVCFAIG